MLVLKICLLDIWRAVLLLGHEIYEEIPGSILTEMKMSDMAFLVVKK